MPRVVLGLLLLLLVIYCVIDCIQSEEAEIRHLPKIVWILLILLFPLAGAAAWLIAGRPRGSQPTRRSVRPVGPTPRRVAPDDDASFLASLDADNEERKRLAQWERELQDRERHLRDRTPPPDGHETDGPDEVRPSRS